MGSKHKVDIELNKIDYTNYDFLSKKFISMIEVNKKHLKKLSNLLNLLGILIFITLFVDDFKYSPFVLLIVAVLAGITSVYIVVSKIKTKETIKEILHPAYNSKEAKHPLKILIYNDKTLDRMDIILAAFTISWSIIYLLWSFYKITIALI